jgi:hypothetical protein
LDWGKNEKHTFSWEGGSRSLLEKLIVAQLINKFVCHFWNPKVYCDLYKKKPAKSEALGDISYCTVF